MINIEKIEEKVIKTLESVGWNKSRCVNIENQIKILEERMFILFLLTYSNGNSEADVLFGKPTSLHGEIFDGLKIRLNWTVWCPVHRWAYPTLRNRGTVHKTVQMHTL